MVTEAGMSMLTNDMVALLDGLYSSEAPRSGKNGSVR